MSFDQTKAFETENGVIFSSNGAGVFSGSISPIGFQAPIGSLYLRTSSPAQLWQKTGATDADWTQMLFSNQGGTGATPPFFFSRGGNLPVGSYLKTGDVVTSDSGQLFPGDNTVVRMTATSATAASETTRIQLQRRTAQSTLSDIAGAFIDIPTGQYKATTTISVDLNTDEEVAAYVVSGKTLKSVVLGVFPVPRTS